MAIIFQFKWPWFLTLLPLIALWVTSYSKPLNPAVKFRGAVTTEFSYKTFSSWIPLFALCLMFISLAQPQWGEWQHEKQARNLILALDVSGSMRIPAPQINNIQATRLDTLKSHVRFFLSGLNVDENSVGVVIFADHALTLTPLTSDLALIPRMLDSIQDGMIGEKTALDTAIQLAVERLRPLPYKDGSKAIILFTDGIQTASSLNLKQAFDAAKTAKIRVYTVMVGRSGRQNIILANLSQGTSGKSFLINSTNDLSMVLETIQTLETASTQNTRSILWQDIYSIPFLMGLLILFIYEIQRKMT